MAKIDINNKLENKIVFSWNDNNDKKEIILYIDQEEENKNIENPFDDLFDFIINKLEINEEIELPNKNEFEKNDNKINSIILAILEPLENEINKIKEKINKISN